VKDFNIVGVLNFISLSALLDFMGNIFNIEFLQGVIVVVVQFLLTFLVRFILDKLNKKNDINE